MRKGCTQTPKRQVLKKYFPNKKNCPPDECGLVKWRNARPGGQLLAPSSSLGSKKSRAHFTPGRLLSAGYKDLLAA
eukprot:6246154-Amphidinium_carterae.1